MRVSVENDTKCFMNCRLSIIVPAFNSEATIARCLDSVKFQLTDDVEVIVVDDGSSDSTSEICNGFSSVDSRFKIIHKDNGGVSSARNAGLDHANGSWITFIDSDDKLADGALGLILNALDFGKDMVVENVIMCETSGECFPILPPGMRTFEEMFGENLCGAVWNKVFKAEIVKGNDIRFDESVSFCEDWLFVGWYCSFINDFYYIGTPCYIEYLPSSYGEKYGKQRDFRNRIVTYSKLRKINRQMSRVWVDTLVMSILCCTQNRRELLENISILKENVGKDIRFVKGRKKALIRSLSHVDSIAIWKMVFCLHYMLKIY